MCWVVYRVCRMNDAVARQLCRAGKESLHKPVLKQGVKTLCKVTNFCSIRCYESSKKRPTER